MTRQYVTIDGNEAAAYVAHKTAEVIVIYPITPSSPMGEHADEWSAYGRTNIWGTVPSVVEMQSEAGAAGAVHGSLQTGSLSTTFTASQGLLLMIPNMFKIAGELTSTVFHIAARTVATHALSIFGDHSDVMAARSTGWAMLFSNSIQEVMDLALISQSATLKARVPFLHVFDGFRTSHEVAKIEQLSDDDIRAMIDDNLVREHRARGLTPDRPVTRGTAQNPDVFFQGREATNPYYERVPEIVQQTMDDFAKQVGRQYHLFDYVGAPDAERVMVVMGSGAETAHETVEHLVAQGEKVGLIKVRLYRPFAVQAFLNAIPSACKGITVLDRTKEPGAIGEPLYQDVVTAIAEQGDPDRRIKVIGGRYGLSSKEFTPEMVKAALDELKTDSPKNHFTVGITDDVTFTSLDVDEHLDTESAKVKRAIFWGLGSDGTVGANKNSIKIIGETTPNQAQGYFVYDSKKSGATTISHLRFGPDPIRSPYLIRQADFIGVHQFGFFERFDMLSAAKPGATLLINAPYEPEEVWDKLLRPVQQQIIDKKLNVYAINGYRVAHETGMGNRINTIMQTCFFAISGILPADEAIDAIKQAIRDTYGKRGEAVVQQNFAAVDAAVANLHRIELPAAPTSTAEYAPVVSDEAPQFVKEFTAQLMVNKGDSIPVSGVPLDGTFPSGINRWEKRNLALEVPVWQPDLCIQCGRCVLLCPHAVIRSKIYDPALLEGAPETFKSQDARWREPALKGKKFTVQIAVEDCTGCGVCVENCPAKDKQVPGRKAINMEPQLPIRETERENWDFFMSLPSAANDAGLNFNTTKNVQLLPPYFEFHGACAGCGETPYLRLLSQLFGERTIVANATGCSSIYGANLPDTSWGHDASGRGVAWSNSLFEDNAEFGMGFRLSLDQREQYAGELLAALSGVVGQDLADAILQADQSDAEAIQAQRARVAQLREVLAGCDDPRCRELLSVADGLERKTVWAIGGDGWAYDIGYGGLDHVLASGRNVNVLVLDTEVYSNTGGQASKATGLGAVAKFAASGKPLPKKDLGMMAMSYGYVYVAQIAMAANERQTIQALREAESYPGPSLVIAYSACISHGINMTKNADQQKLAVASGHWPLYRYDPRRREAGQNPLQLDSKAPSVPLKDYIYNENRYRMLQRSDPERAAMLLAEAEKYDAERWRKYEHLAAMTFGSAEGEASTEEASSE